METAAPVRVVYLLTVNGRALRQVLRAGIHHKTSQNPQYSMRIYKSCLQRTTKTFYCPRFWYFSPSLPRIFYSIKRGS